MDHNTYMNEEIHTMFPVNSYDELEQPPASCRYAQAFDKHKSTDQEPYFFFYENGEWSKESELINPIDMNVKIHVMDSWNSAIQMCIDQVRNANQKTFTQEDLVSMFEALKMRN